MAKIFSLLILIFYACSSDGDLNNFQPKEAEKLPIIMMHGALASGDTYARIAQLFTSNGYDPDLIYAFDWNSLGGSSTAAATELDAYINTILSKTGKQKVYLAGHSAGGGLGYTYCSVAGRASKIAKYVHIGAAPQTKPAGPNGEVATMNIYSKGDKVVAGADIPGAQNVVFESFDHYEVATSSATFEKMYSFFLDGEKPSTTDILPLESPKIRGRVVSLGENKPNTNTTVKIFKVDPSTAERIGDAIFTFTPTLDGSFGPYSVERNSYYEFEITSSDPTFRTLHYYREPFIHNNPFVYLRVFPPATSVAGLLLSNLPSNDEQSVFAVFSSNKAMLHQRDSLIVKKLDLATPQLTAAQNSTIAMFLYDGGDMKSSGNPHAAFSLFPFLRAADIFINTACSEGIPIKFNTRTLVVKNYKSKSEGVVIAVFD